MQQITWPAVALALIAAAFLWGIFVVIPDDQPAMRSALLGMVMLIGQAVVGFISTKSGHDMAERLAELEKAVRESTTD